MTSSLLTIDLNGSPTDVGTGVTVAALVAAETEADRGVAVAVNRELVPRSLWASTCLAAGDSVEILTASQGG